MAKRKSVKKKKNPGLKRKKVPPKKSADIPATQGMLYGVRDELMSRFMGLEHKFEGLEKKFDGLEQRFEGLRNEFNGLREDVNAAVNRVVALVEAQKAENRYVLDGYTQLYERQDRLEKKIDGK